MSGDGDLGAGQPQAVDVDVPAVGENDGAPGGGNRLDAIAERTRALGIEIGDDVNIPSPPAFGIAAVALRTGKCGDRLRGGVGDGE